MKRILGFALLALALSLPASAQIRVAVEDGTGTGAGAAVAAQLNDDTWFDFTATVVTASQIDTPAELANYDVVVIGDDGNTNSDWTSGMASALSTWVAAGGGLVATGWTNYFLDPNQTNPPSVATWAALVPGENLNTYAYRDGTDTIAILNTGHPVTQGLTNFAPGGNCCIEVNPYAPESGDTVLANMADDSSQHVVMVLNYGSGRSVYLGPIYMGNPASSSYVAATAALRTGNGDRLLEQAVAWAANAPATAAASVPVNSPRMLVSLLALLAVAGTFLLRPRA